jgi:hypothetical protein
VLLVLVVELLQDYSEVYLRVKNHTEDKT